LAHVIPWKEYLTQFELGLKNENVVTHEHKGITAGRDCESQRAQESCYRRSVASVTQTKYTRQQF